MPDAKVRRLTVQASQVAHLAFNVEGILDQMNVTLGDNVAAGFDFDGFYRQMGRPTPGNASLLYYDSNGIITEAKVKASLLCWLRAEPARAALDSAIGTRQNAYYAKYANQGTIITQMQNNYGAGPAAKPALLSDLAAISGNQSYLLGNAYAADGLTGVVKHTHSHLTSKTKSRGDSTATSEGQAQGYALAQSAASTEDSTQGSNDQYNFQTSTSSGQTWRYVSQENNDVGQTTGETSGSTTTNSNQSSEGQTVTDSTGKMRQNQHVVNTDYGYRVPSAEAQAANLRAQVSLIDEQFAQFMAGQSIPNLATVFTNELQAIDAGIKQLQVAFMDTLLLTPIAGTVTGIFKNPGDYVHVGEPVVRVEQASPVYLVGTLICPDMISVGQRAIVTTKLFGRGGGSTPLPGSIVAARGHTSEIEWDVVIRYPNPAPGGHPILPLNYHFDFDDTTVQIF